MGVVLMSERELNRIEVLSRVEDGSMTATQAADLLNLIFPNAVDDLFLTIRPQSFRSTTS